MTFVSDILNHKGRSVWSILPDAPLEKALNLLSEKNIGALTVVGEDGALTGILTERDVVRYCAGHKEPYHGSTVGDVMSPNVVCVKEEQTIEHCMVIMTEKRSRHLPVLKDNKIVGIISIGDVVNSMIHEKDLLIDQLEHYIVGSLY